jgi:hypothetical protein
MINVMHMYASSMGGKMREPCMTAMFKGMDIAMQNIKKTIKAMRGRCASEVKLFHARFSSMAISFSYSMTKMEQTNVVVAAALKRPVKLCETVQASQQLFRERYGLQNPSSPSSHSSVWTEKPRWKWDPRCPNSSPPLPHVRLQ